MAGIDRTTVINTALRRLAAADINIPTGNASPSNALAEAAYPGVLRRLLSEYPWSFSTEYVELARLAVTPVYGYEYAYQMPGECLRFISAHVGRESVNMEGETILAVDLGAPLPLYERVGRAIYCNSDNLFAKIVASGHESLAHEPFIDALEYLLAAELCVSITQGTGAQGTIIQLYQQALYAAICFDAQEQNPMLVSDEQASRMVQNRFQRTL